MDSLEQSLQREKNIRQNMCENYEYENLHTRINFQEELIKNLEKLIEDNKFSPNEHLTHIEEIEQENKIIKTLLDKNLKLLQNIIEQDILIENLKTEISFK